MADPFEMCTYCPRLCRHVCPVAVVTGREAATPTAMMTAVYLADRGLLPVEEAWRQAALCTGCDRCTEHCRYSWEVARHLAQARGRLVPPPPVDPLPVIEGTSDRVAVECGGRRWAEALTRRLGLAVARVSPTDHFGAPLADHARGAQPHRRALQALFRGRTAITACRQCAATLADAGVEVVSLEAVVPLRWTGPVMGAGWAVPAAWAAQGVPDPPHFRGDVRVFARAHPEVVLELARDLAGQAPPDRLLVLDEWCAATLRGAGRAAVDPVDLLLAEVHP